MNLSHIVATDKNRVIGFNGKMPWPRLPNDLKRFKQTTMNHPIIMGRKTLESLPNKGLPGRRNIIVSRTLLSQDIETFDSIDKAIEAAKTSNTEIFIIGGGELYKQTMHLIDTIYLTEIEAEYAGDTFYPLIPDDFKLISKLTDIDSGIKLTFKVLRRI